MTINLDKLIANAPEGATHYNTQNEWYYKFTTQTDCGYFCDDGEWYSSARRQTDIEREGEEFISLIKEIPQEETSVETQKPPIGLVPRHIFDEQCKEQRINDIRQAMKRYIDSDLHIPL